jgi:hypothetical protein
MTSRGPHPSPGCAAARVAKAQHLPDRPSYEGRRLANLQQVSDVHIGHGNLQGKGVYADRDFAAGEPVITFQLQAIDEAQYLRLPVGDDTFVHSYGGRRYLYPSPARYVNHSDEPSCFQDFDRCCDVALRNIAKGEAITIDANQETGRELSTFLDAYTLALRSRCASSLGMLIDRGVTAWRLGAAIRGREALVEALLDVGPERLHDVEWLVGTGRWEAICSAGTGSDPHRQHLTMLLKVVLGNWQLVYQHVG